MKNSSREFENLLRITQCYFRKFPFSASSRNFGTVSHPALCPTRVQFLTDISSTYHSREACDYLIESSSDEDSDLEDLEWSESQEDGLSDLDISISGF